MSTLPIHHQYHENLEKLKFLSEQKSTAISIGNNTPSDISYQSVEKISEDGSVLSQLKDHISSYLKDQNNELDFHIDPNNGDVVISIVNKETQAVISNIPIDKMVLDKSELRDLKSIFYNVRA